MQAVAAAMGEHLQAQRAERDRLFSLERALFREQRLALLEAQRDERRALERVFGVEAQCQDLDKVGVQGPKCFFIGGDDEDEAKYQAEYIEDGYGEQPVLQSQPAPTPPPQGCNGLGKIPTPGAGGQGHAEGHLPRPAGGGEGLRATVPRDGTSDACILDCRACGDTKASLAGFGGAEVGVEQESGAQLVCDHTACDKHKGLQHNGNCELSGTGGTEARVRLTAAHMRSEAGGDSGGSDSGGGELGHIEPDQSDMKGLSPRDGASGTSISECGDAGASLADGKGDQHRGGHAHLGCELFPIMEVGGIVEESAARHDEYDHRESAHRW